VAWWLSDYTTTLDPGPVAKQAPIPTMNLTKVPTNPAKYIQQEVQKLNEEVSYLFRLQNLTEVTRLHLRTCCSALDQCVKVHIDKNLGHVQLWELLQQLQNAPPHLTKIQCSQLKHLCMQYREKLSNLIVLAGVPVQPRVKLLSFSDLPRINYPAFRDQMIHRFKDTKSWKEFQFIQTDKAAHACCKTGDFNVLSSSTDWTIETGKLFQDVLGRFYDHTSDLFGSSLKPCQEGLFQHINAFKGKANFATLKSCAHTLYLPFYFPFSMFLPAHMLGSILFIIYLATYESFLTLCARSS